MTDVNNETHLRAFSDALPNLRLVKRTDVTLLGAAMGDRSLESALHSFVSTLYKFRERLLKLSAHDALFLLRNCLAIPKLLHTLRTSASYRFSNILSEIDCQVFQPDSVIPT